MAEPTVPVPVSLIERNMAAARGQDWVRKWNVANELHALLSQPTPTAELMSTEQIGQEYLRLITAPPSITDMAPGTTFIEEVRWIVTGMLSTGIVVAHSKDGMRFADRFDPSTIRDVQIPKEHP